MKSSKKIVVWTIFAVLIAYQAESTWTETVTVRVTDGYQGDGFWLRTFDTPLTRSTMPHGWRFVETDEAKLELAMKDEVALVALQKGSVPLVQQVGVTAHSRIVELEFREGRSIRGEIVSADGHPIRNASVEIRKLDGLLTHQLPDGLNSVWISDNEGRVNISGLQTDSYEIDVVVREGFPAHTHRVQFDADEPRVKVERIRIPFAHFISGEVVDQSEKLVVADVVAYDVLRIDSRLQQQSIKTQSNVKGEFLIGPFLKGLIVYLEAEAPGNRFSATREAYAGYAGLKLKMRDSLNLRGSVLDAETSTPVEVFKVAALSGNANTLWTRERTYYGVDGDLNFEELDWRVSHIVVEAPGFEFLLIRVRFEDGGDVDMGTIKLDVGRTLTGVVVDIATGDPIQGARIGHIGPDKPIEWYMHFIRNMREDATTDSSGRFTLAGLPRDKAEIFVYAPKYEGVTANLNEGQSFIRIELGNYQDMRDREFEEARIATIRGRVETEDGRPLQARVMFRNLESDGDTYQWGAVSNRDGIFKIATEDGRFEVWAETAEYGSSLRKELNVQNQNAVNNVQLTVDTSTGILTGNVSGLGASEGVTIEVHAETQDQIRHLYLDGNQEYRLGGLSAGLYRVVATTSMERQISVAIEVGSDIEPVVVNFDFLGRSKLSGTVFSANRPVPNVKIAVLASTEGDVGGATRSQVDGSYVIQDIEDGHYTVQTGRRGRSFEVVVSGDTTYDVLLGELWLAGTIESEYSNADMTVVLEPLKDDGVGNVGASVDVDSLGKFRIDGLEPGTYQVRVFHDGEVVSDSNSTLNHIDLNSSIDDYRIQLNSE